jgi:predicted exporter
MRNGRAKTIALWTIGMAAAAWVVVHARYVTDLSAFLPAHPTATQELLVEQLRDGPAARVILIALENADADTRAQISRLMASRLRLNAAFTSVENGEPVSAAKTQSFLFQHRYLLSDAVTPQHFTANGLHEALEVTIAGLASSTGLLLKSLVPRDPTGEMLHLIDQLTPPQTPQTQDGVWVAEGKRALLIVQTAAAGSDTDAQQRALEIIRRTFETSRNDTGPRASSVTLKMSGPGVFAVAARARIQTAAVRLSVISSLLVVMVLLTVYRSIPALILGLLPVASGALVGIAAVSLGFGVVHGITLGFGVTLIGEAVDYSIYFFIQTSRHGLSNPGIPGQNRLWPTIRLGMLTSTCGFASLLPSGFPGLAQLGLYSISGLITAALVTRFVLPVLLPKDFKIRDVTSLGVRLGAVRDTLRSPGGRTIGTIASILTALALLTLYRHHDTLWDRELSSLSPISPADLRYDATLRKDLKTADVLDLIVITAPTLDAALFDAEHVGEALQPLIAQRIISGFESPANYLPSLATQRIRRAALPDERALRENLELATRGLDLKDNLLPDFISDVEDARQAGTITAADLNGTSLRTGFDALMLNRGDHWSALVPLHASLSEVSGEPLPIDAALVRAALAHAPVKAARLLDLKAQTDGLYSDYLHEAMRLSAAGFLTIIGLLLLALRSVSRVLRVLAPLVLAVLVVAATLTMFGQQFTILHLVGMLLIVAVGSNYALFFDKESVDDRHLTSPLTLASLGIANLSTVIGFGLLSFSHVPVLEALGVTVAPGTFLALLFSAVMTSRVRPEGLAHA